MNRALSYIGIAKKAGKLTFGTDAVCDALRRGGKNPVFAASDISAATEKKLSDKCAFYGVRLVRLKADTSALGHAIGKTGAVAAVYVTDAGLANAVLGAITNEN